MQEWVLRKENDEYHVHELLGGTNYVEGDAVTLRSYEEAVRHLKNKQGSHYVHCEVCDGIIQLEDGAVKDSSTFMGLDDDFVARMWYGYEVPEDEDDEPRRPSVYDVYSQSELL